MDLSFLPNEIKNALNNVDMSKVKQIRLRLNFPIILDFLSGKSYLGKRGQSILKSESLICKDNYIKQIIDTVTENSIYKHNEKIKQGYLSYGQVRIGLGGECVFDGDKIITIKNINSLNIRLPHNVNDCAKELYNIIKNQNNILNSLIISPPAIGKTTMLKDLALKINNDCLGSLLIIDERGEFEEINGENIDKLSFSNKDYAFNNALRSLSPEIVITDELSNDSDWSCAKKASVSGVRIIASCHGESIEDVKNNPLLVKGVFKRYLVLDSKNLGVIKTVFNENFMVIR